MNLTSFFTGMERHPRKLSESVHPLPPLAGSAAFIPEAQSGMLQFPSSQT
jgi:hypothetical protein